MRVNIAFYFHREDTIEYHIPFHSHQCHELVYYYSGSGHCFIEKKRYNYKPNSMIVVPKNTSHNDVHEENCKIFCIGFTLDKEPAFPSLCGAYEDKDGLIETYLHLLSREIESSSKNVQIINNLLENIILELSRLSSFSTTPIYHISHSIEQVINYINEYFLTEIDLNYLASIANYSYHRFRHLFKNTLGISPTQYIKQKRLEYAKQLLTTTDSSITEIAYQCSFSSTSLFIQQFKKYAGITPQKYRLQIYSQTEIIEKSTDPSHVNSFRARQFGHALFLSPPSPFFSKLHKMVV